MRQYPESLKEYCRLEKLKRIQELKEAYDRGFSQGYSEGCKDTKEEQKYEEENNWE